MTTTKNPPYYPSANFYPALTSPSYITMQTNNAMTLLTRPGLFCELSDKKLNALQMKKFYHVLEDDFILLYDTAPNYEDYRDRQFAATGLIHPGGSKHSIQPITAFIDLPPGGQTSSLTAGEQGISRQVFCRNARSLPPIGHLRQNDYAARIVQYRAQRTSGILVANHDRDTAGD